ncbi:MAG: hypothetical protein ACK551_05090 [Vampirovibrionales bacterium]
MTTIPPSYMNYSYAQQPVQAVAPTAGNATNSAVMSQANSLQQSPPLNTTTPPQLQQIQQQYVNQIPPTAMPTAPVDPLGQSNLSTPGDINSWVANASRAADVLIAQQAQAQAQQTQAVAPAVAPQVVSPAQQVLPATTPLGQTVTGQVVQAQEQQQMTTVPPTTASSSTNANPQSQPQQTAPQVGQSDGQGNILWRNPQGQLQWMPEAQVLAMYQAGKETGGSVQLPDGTWAKKTTVESATAKIQARLKLKELLDQGKITPDDFKLAGGDQDLSGILGSTQQTKNAKALARMKEAASGSRDIADLGGASPYSSFSPSAGGGSETG